MMKNLKNRNNYYETGTGQTIYNVHDISECIGEYCVIHNPSDHKMKDWPTHWREDIGLMERICKHGVGHPDPDDVAFKKKMTGEDHWNVHGCDGCCYKDVKIESEVIYDESGFSSGAGVS